MVRRLLTWLLVYSSASFAANDAPQSFTLDGTLSNYSGSAPLLDPNLTVKIQILDPARTCILYEEVEVINTATTQGQFNIRVGSNVGALVRSAGDAGNSMAQIFQNSANISGRMVSNPTLACSHTATAGSVRYARITVTPTAGVPETLSPDMVINSVPNALVAESVGGLEIDQWLRKDRLLSINSKWPFLRSLISQAGSRAKRRKSQWL